MGAPGWKGSGVALAGAAAHELVQAVARDLGQGLGPGTALVRAVEGSGDVGTELRPGLGGRDAQDASPHLEPPAFGGRIDLEVELGGADVGDHTGLGDDRVQLLGHGAHIADELGLGGGEALCPGPRDRDLLVLLGPRQGVERAGLGEAAHVEVDELPQLADVGHVTAEPVGGLVELHQAQDVLALVDEGTRDQGTTLLGREARGDHTLLGELRDRRVHELIESDVLGHVILLSLMVWTPATPCPPIFPGHVVCESSARTQCLQSLEYSPGRGDLVCVVTRRRGLPERKRKGRSGLESLCR